MGCFCWYKLRGKRDEGVIVITAYRVCHEKWDQPGPFTAFQQQYIVLRSQGHQNPNPQRQILTDIQALIDSAQADGYRPIVMMDANGDIQPGKDMDKDLPSFVRNAGLSDPFYDRFEISPPTTTFGSTRIDYIFVDPALAPAVVRIGYLGSHEGADTDHCLAYVDFDKQTLFRGIINRPVARHSREILIEHDDKVRAFMETAKGYMKDHAIPDRVTKLESYFQREGAMNQNIASYTRLYKEFLDLCTAAAKQTGRKKFGYMMRSQELTSKGRILLLFRHMLDCRRRRAPPTTSILRRCTKLQIDATLMMTMTYKELRKEAQRQQVDLWETQKRSESLWME